MGLWFNNRRTRQIFLTVFGPLSIFLLLGLWALMILVSYALLHFGLKTQLNAPESQCGLGLFLYLSGTTFFTLGRGDVVPLNAVRKVLVVAEVGTGIIFLYGFSLTSGHYKKRLESHEQAPSRDY